MSSAEIADNKWELSSTKPPIATAAGLGQIVIISGLGLFFVWIIISSIIGIVTPKDDNAGIAGDFKNLTVEGKPAEAAE